MSSLFGASATHEYIDLQDVTLKSLQHALHELHAIPNSVIAISFDLFAPVVIVHLYLEANTFTLTTVEQFDGRIRNSFRLQFSKFGNNGLGLIVIPIVVMEQTDVARQGYPVYLRPGVTWTDPLGRSKPVFKPVTTIDDPRLKSLREWNELSRRSAETAVTNSMFEATFLANEPIDKFVTWLLLGGAATGSFLIINAEKVLPLLGAKGYLWCGLVICASCLFGLVAKFAGAQLKNMLITRKATEKSFSEQLTKHSETEEKIKKIADGYPVEIDTSLRMPNILSEFFRLMPKFPAKLIAKFLKKRESDPQIANILPAKLFLWQGVNAGLQALCWLIFLICGLAFATHNYVSKEAPSSGNGHEERHANTAIDQAIEIEL